MSKTVFCPREVSHVALADEILPERPGHHRAVSSLPNRDHLTRLRVFSAYEKKPNAECCDTAEDMYSDGDINESRTEAFSGNVCAEQRVTSSCCATKCFAPPGSTRKRTDRLEVTWIQQCKNPPC